MRVVWSLNLMSSIYADDNNDVNHSQCIYRTALQMKYLELHRSDKWFLLLPTLT